jgi:phosphotriesterase-related protein
VKKIMTVLGPVDPEEVGVAMMHEHIVIDLSCNFVEPQEASMRARMHDPITPDMIWLLKRRPFSVTLDNMVLGDEEVAIEEIGYYWREGGETIVDCTSVGIGRDPLSLCRVSRATGVHVVMGAGCYVENAHPQWVREMDVEGLKEVFVHDVMVGAEGTNIRSGIIGEIGTTGVPRGSLEKQGHITAEEEKVLRAAGRAAAETGTSVSVHLDLRGQGAFQIVEILEDEGVARDRMVMGHMDLLPDIDYHREVAKLGVVLEYDSLGREYYSDELGLCWGHDVWRVDALATLVREGYVDQLVLSQDIALKMDLRRYGGNGYAHVLASVVPMLRRAGVPEDAIHKMLISNPRRVLTVDWDEEALQSDAFNTRRRGLQGAAS